MTNHNNGLYIRLLITGLIMFNFAICFALYTMYFPEKGLTFSTEIKLIIYAVYILIMLGCFISAFSVGRNKNR